MLQKILFTLFIVHSYCVFSQENAGYHRISPLAIGNGQATQTTMEDSVRLDVQLYYQQYEHPFQDINTADISCRYRTKYMIVGGEANTENEGPFIRRSRAYITCGTQLPITQNLTAAVLISAGMQTFAFESQTDAIAGSATVPDLATGIGVVYKYLGARIWIRHLLNNSVMPMRNELPLHRYAHLQLLGKTQIHRAQVSTTLFSEIYQDKKNKHWLCADVLLREHFGAGAGISSNRKYLFKITYIAMRSSDYPVSLYAGRQGAMGNVTGTGLPSWHLGAIIKTTK